MLGFALYKDRKGYIQVFFDKRNLNDSPSGSVSKESTCNGGDPSLIPGSGGSLGEANGYPLQYSYLGNLMDRGAWQAMVHWVTRVRHNLATTANPNDNPT